MIYTRPLYLTLIGLAVALVASSVSKYDAAQAAEEKAKTLAETVLVEKQKALRSSISSAMYVLGERNLAFTSEPCIAQLDDGDEAQETGIDIATYRCNVTTPSGVMYEAEVELMTTAGELFAMPAFLTEIDTEEAL